MNISVALCTYNGEKFLREQIESILAQESEVDEIVVCDDRSTDSTWGILEEFQRNYPDLFRIFKNENTLRVTQNFEKAINLCTKDIILLCDQDDLWLPNKTKEIKKYFEENPEKKAVCHDLQLLKKGQILDYSNWFTLNFDPSELDEMSFIDRLLFRGNVITGAGFAFRNFGSKIKMDQLSSKFLHDRQLGLYFALENKLGIISKPLAIYRLHENQQVGTDLRIRDAKILEFEKFRNADSRLKINFYNSSMEYWNQNMKFVNQQKVNNIILAKLKQQRHLYFSSLPLFRRKAQTLIWIINNRFFTTWKEFFIIIFVLSIF